MKAILLLLVLCALPSFVFSKTREEMGAYYSNRAYDVEVKEDRFKVKVTERLVILNKRGDDHRFVGATKSPFARIDDLKAVVYNARGKKVYERKGKDFHRARGYGAYFELYNDMKMYQAECSAPGYPYTIQLSYELEYNTLFFWRGEQVQMGIPVDTFDYRLKIRSDLPYAVRQDELVPPPVEQRDGDWTKIHWHQTDIPAFDYDAYIPGLHEPAGIKFVARELSLGNHDLAELSWDGIAGWYRELASERYLEGAERSPSGPAPEDAMVEIARLYREVIDNSRYVAVSIGMSGWQPAAADETESCGYGDCKGLSTLLISKLRLAGIPAYPVLVLTRDMGTIDPAFPEFGFNHLIAVAIVGGDTLWFDPTCSTCPVGELPRSDEGIPVLLITDESGTVVTSPESVAEDNLVVNRSTVTILPDGNAECVSEIAVSGNSAITFRNLIPHLERGDEITLYRRWIDNPVATDLVDHRYENLDELEAPLLIALTARTRRPFHLVDGCWFAGMPLLSDPIGWAMRDFDDSLPAVDLRYPRRLIDSVTFVFAEGSNAEFLLPDSTSISASFAGVRLSGETRPDTGIVVIDRTTDSYRISAEDFVALREYHRQLSSVLSTAVVVCEPE